MVAQSRYQPALPSSFFVQDASVSRTGAGQFHGGQNDELFDGLLREFSG
ncbi:hypothetical protein [Rhizobium sp. 1399]|nr:hypothetical protein [Rhizobium sp. 1399]MDR6671195.1 hypothetical protein [Rhizobium sp. 1399]